MICTTLFWSSKASTIHTNFNHCFYSFLTVIFHLRALSHVWTDHNEGDANLRLALGVWRWWSGIIRISGSEMALHFAKAVWKRVVGSEKWTTHAMRSSYWNRGKFGRRRQLGGEESIVAASGPHRAEERELERTVGVFVQLILSFSSESLHFKPSTFPSLRAHARPCTLPRSALTDLGSLVLLLVDHVPTMTFEASWCLQNFNFIPLALGIFPIANSVNITGGL